MLYLPSSLSSQLDDKSSSSSLICIGGLQPWFLVSQGHVGILGVLGYYSLLALAEGYSYFLEDVLLVLSEVRSPNIVLSLSVYIIGFSSPTPLPTHAHIYLISYCEFYYLFSKNNDLGDCIILIFKLFVYITVVTNGFDWNFFSFLLQYL